MKELISLKKVVEGGRNAGYLNFLLYENNVTLAYSAFAVSQLRSRNSITTNNKFKPAQAKLPAEWSGLMTMTMILFKQ